MNPDRELRRSLAAAARRAWERRLQLGNGGNVSARCSVPDHMLVTASGGSLGDCAPESFLVTDFGGTVLEGTGKPTREALMHGRIYALRPDVGAIVHVHSPWAVALSHRAESIARVTLHSQLKLSTDIPIVPVPAAWVRDEDWHLVKAVLGARPDIEAFVLRDHGIVALSSDPLEAEHLAELIEETAQVACIEFFLDIVGGRAREV